jgi:hypothetical protein
MTFNLQIFYSVERYCKMAVNWRMNKGLKGTGAGLLEVLSKNLHVGFWDKINLTPEPKALQLYQPTRLKSKFYM